MPRLTTSGIVFAILGTLFVAFPPWFGYGYAPIWDSPARGARVDITRLLVELAAGLFVAFWIGFVIAPICRAFSGKIARYCAGRRRLIAWTSIIIVLLLVIIGAAIVCSTSNYVAAKRAQPSGGGISGLDSSANVIQSRRLADEQKEKEVFSHNSQLYWSLKKFVDDHRVIKFPPPSIGDGYMVRYEQASARLEWEELTRPFRVGQLLTREQRDALLDFLGKGVVNEALKSDPSYSQAIDDLGKWEF